MIKVTFARAYGAHALNPVVLISPTGANSAALTGTNQVFLDMDGDGTDFFIHSGTTALSAATVYSWNYHVIGKQTPP